MKLIFALVFNLSVSLMSCRNIKYIEVDPNNYTFDKQSTSTETDNQKIFLDKMRFLKLLPFNNEWKNTINERTLESKTKNKNAVPFTVIVRTPDSNLNQFKNSELRRTSVKGEELVTVGEEPIDKSNGQVKSSDNDDESKLRNDNKGITYKNIEEPISKVTLHMDPQSNTGADNINNELRLNNPQVRDESNIETQLESVMIQKNDAETARLIAVLSKADSGSEKTLHHNGEIHCKHTVLEVKNDPKGTTACKPELCKASMQTGSCYEHEINVHEDEPNPYPIYFVVNKYVFVK